MWGNNGGMRRLFSSLLLGLSLLQLSCASAGYTPTASPMPAARLGLRPEFRVFYDALADYGQWTLIEPYGFVFHPRGTYADWRPYADGFWVPSDSWGWIWVSAEPYGWATYHYGRWFYDDFEGWVWQPDLDWGPAWVSWQGNDLYVGWSPLGPIGGGNYDPARIPGGAYVYAPIQQLPSADLRARLVKAPDLAASNVAMQPIRNLVERDGRRINLGPDIRRIERAAGVTLTRARVEDLVPHAEPVVRSTDTTSEADLEDIHPLVESLRRAAEDAARQAQTIRTQSGESPVSLPVVRSVVLPPARKSGALDAQSAPASRHLNSRSGRPEGAKADTLR